MKKIKDFYFKKAKEEKYAARSVYKLIEIDNKYRILKKGLSILDIGCVPGSWTQYMLKKIGNGNIVGIDIKNSMTVKDTRLRFINADIFTISPDELDRNLFGLIISDAAPSTTGSKFMNSQLSLELVKRVFRIAGDTLKVNGSVVAKVFQGEDVKDFIQKLNNDYTKVSLFKPKSSRKESRELFIIALGMKSRQRAH